SRQARAMTHVKAINGLHQATYRFLQKVRVAQGVVAEAFCNVGSQANIGGSEPVFVMDIAVMKAANRCNIASFLVTVISNELGHRPGLKRGTMRSEPRKMADQYPHQLAFAL